MFKEGQICLSEPLNPSFIQKCIQFFTRSKWTHSFIVIRGPYNILSAMETTSTLIVPTPVDRKYFENQRIHIWETDIIHLTALADLYYRKSGKWYGYLSYLWFMYAWFCGLFGREQNRMWKWASGDNTCTELTSIYLKDVYPELFKGIDINTITPQKLDNIMLSNRTNGKFRFIGELITGR